ARVDVSRSRRRGGRAAARFLVLRRTTPACDRGNGQARRPHCSSQRKIPANLIRQTDSCGGSPHDPESDLQFAPRPASTLPSSGLALPWILAKAVMSSWCLPTPGGAVSIAGQL